MSRGEAFLVGAILVFVAFAGVLLTLRLLALDRRQEMQRRIDRRFAEPENDLWDLWDWTEAEPETIQREADNG